MYFNSHRTQAQAARKDTRKPTLKVGRSLQAS
jgi:hypothetical protein